MDDAPKTTDFTSDVRRRSMQRAGSASSPWMVRLEKIAAFTVGALPVSVVMALTTMDARWSAAIALEILTWCACFAVWRRAKRQNAEVSRPAAE